MSDLRGIVESLMHWDTCSAFGVAPGMHEGLVNNMLATADWVVNHANITADERARAVNETTESVKAAMVIRRADKRRYGQLKINLANN